MIYALVSLKLLFTESSYLDLYRVIEIFVSSFALKTNQQHACAQRKRVDLKDKCFTAFKEIKKLKVVNFSCSVKNTKIGGVLFDLRLWFKLCWKTKVLLV